ncbi:FBD-associated F-box protein At2g26860-like [Chenopodium quinoa]|uniref:FBD-associated F-box protein At2g26860-like n=1 Tax=Chenopodium quinoa TaxID=63459 RepID=UPI000B7965CF|nr:FBD-associated F-box protein At2g26860-like [Chenopodium quinoa]
MSENQHTLNPVRRRRRRLTDDGEDRLSSLPDAILTEILSCLPINSAATTSVLSRRWRHLWTGVTRFEIYNIKSRYPPDFLSIVSNILMHLTSPKIDVFKIQVRSIITLVIELDELESFFHEICRRNVQQLICNGEEYCDKYFPVPTCLLSCQSLVTLELFGSLEYDWEKNKNRDVQLKLPNLKKLTFCYLRQVPPWLDSLSESSPLLEELTLMFALFGYRQLPNTMPLLNLSFPNLKSLNLMVEACYEEPGVDVISIDAPKLTHLQINHIFGYHLGPLPYKFCHNPTALVKACINFYYRDKDEVEDENEDEVEDEDEDEEIHWFFEFFRGMSSIYNLELKLQQYCNVFTDLSVNVNLLMFSNLVHLTTTLDRVDLNGCKDLLVSLQCFPNLKHLHVKLEEMDYGSKMKHRNWHAPDIVPSCLMSKLKTIDIKGLQLSGSIGGLKLLGYILGNAKVLEKLYLEDVWFHERTKQETLWTECEFCRSLYKLPRSSSTCEVVFSGRFITSSSNTFKNGRLTFQ